MFREQEKKTSSSGFPFNYHWFVQWGTQIWSKLHILPPGSFRSWQKASFEIRFWERLSSYIRGEDGYKSGAGLFHVQIEEKLHVVELDQDFIKNLETSSFGEGKWSLNIMTLGKCCWERKG